MKKGIRRKNSVVEELSQFDIFKLKQVLNYQYGNNIGDLLITGGNIKALKSKRTQRMKNIYVDGRNIMNLRAEDGQYIITMDSAEIILKKTKTPSLRIIVSDEAIPYVRKGFSLFCKHVINGDKSLRPEDIVILVDKKDRLIGIGRLTLTLEEIKSLRRGVAVRVKKTKTKHCSKIEQ